SQQFQAGFVVPTQRGKVQRPGKLESRIVPIVTAEARGGGEERRPVRKRLPVSPGVFDRLFEPVAGWLVAQVPVNRQPFLLPRVPVDDRVDGFDEGAVIGESGFLHLPQITAISI